MLPTDAAARKRIPIWSGCFKYFPKALAAIAQLSFVANEQHNPGTPVHWDKRKSQDELDALMRHLDEIAQGIDYDCDPVVAVDILQDVKVAWRALANLERKLDAGVVAFRPRSNTQHEPGSIIPCSRREFKGGTPYAVCGRCSEEFRYPGSADGHVCFRVGRKLP